MTWKDVAKTSLGLAFLLGMPALLVTLLWYNPFDPEKDLGLVSLPALLGGHLQINWEAALPVLILGAIFAAALVWDLRKRKSRSSPTPPRD